MSFNVLDLIIVIAVLMAVGRGATSGFVRQIFSLGGFLGGLMLGAAIAPYFGRLVGDPALRSVIILLVVLAVATAIGGLGEVAGHYLAHWAEKLRIGALDNILGAVFGGITILLSFWLIASMIVGTPYLALNQFVNGSGIIRSLDRSLPPAPTVISRLVRLVDPNGFPRVFTGLEPLVGGSVTPATTAEVASAIRADQASTVKVEGSGCGGLVSGSGFVAAAGVGMTNAHVVAGIANPTVIDAFGRHNATVVEFDPNMDIAVLRADNLAGPVLPLETKEMAPGTHAVVLGYPGGGPFAAVEAGIIDERLATGRNIYDAGITDREIYSLQTVVQPGNSGGPLVLADGRVIGLVFARSENNSNLGYALTAAEITARLHDAINSRGSTGSGACAAG